MQILVDILNEKSEKLIRQMKLDRNFRECKIIELPKGHGRLIDVDTLTMKLKAWDISVNGIPNYAWKCIRETPTIIEADKEVENEKM